MTEDSKEQPVTSENDISDSQNDGSDGPWRTPIIKDEDGKPIGASIFLTVQDLDELDISIRGGDEIQYDITENGAIRLLDDSDW